MIVITPNDSFSRPANTTAYADGDLVANSATAGSVVPLKFSLNGIARSGMIRRVRLHKTSNTTTAATFSVHLFDSEPTVANGDNGAFAVATNLDSWLGKVAIDMSTGAEAGGSANVTQVSSNVEIGLNKPAPGGLIYALIEVNGAYAPASSETFTVRLEIEG